MWTFTVLSIDFHNSVFGFLCVFVLWLCVCVCVVFCIHFGSDFMHFYHRFSLMRTTFNEYIYNIWNADCIYMWIRFRMVFFIVFCLVFPLKYWIRFTHFYPSVTACECAFMFMCNKNFVIDSLTTYALSLSLSFSLSLCVCEFVLNLYQFAIKCQRKHLICIYAS